MRALVTGCAGFIGSHLSERLLQAGADVTGCDCLTDYYDPALKRRNIEVCLEHGRFRFLELPVADVPDEIIDGADVIFHLAGQPGVRRSWGAAFQTYVDRNVVDTQGLLERAAKSTGLKRLVYASSSSVYGNTVAENVGEDDPKQPHSPYGVTKLAGEHLCSLYAANTGLPAVSLRLFTVFGPRQRPDMMFHRLIHAALVGEPFAVYGDGAMRRDFTSVHDIVEAFLLAAGTETDVRVFNVAGGQVAALHEAIALVEALAGRKVKTEYRGERRGDVRKTSADTTRAATVLGYRPRWTLAETLRLQIADLEELLSRNGGRVQVVGCPAL